MTRAVLITVLNFIVGFFATQLNLGATEQEQIVNMLADIIGLFIILATSIVSLVKFWQTRHVIHIPSPVVETPAEVTKVFTPPVPVFTEQVDVNNSGTPPAPSVHNQDTISTVQ